MTLGETRSSIVVLACHWLGDTFWASQAVTGVVARLPATRVVVYSKPGCLDLWRGVCPPGQVRPAPYITSDRRREAVDIPALLAAAWAARRERHDLVIDLTGNRYSALFVLMTGARHAIGFDGGWLGRWVYDKRVRIPQPDHLAYRPWRVCVPLLGEFAPADPRPVATLPESYPQAVAACGLQPERPLVVVAPGSGWPTKQWRPEHYRELVEGLARQGLQVAVCGGGTERRLCEEVAAAGACGMARAVAGWSLGRVMALLSGCAAFVGNDSGLGHIAAAYSRPVFTLFTGATDPAACRPLGCRVTVLDTRDAATTPERLAAGVIAACLAPEPPAVPASRS